MSTEPSRWHRYPFWRAYIGRDFIDALPPWPNTLRNNDKGFYLQSKAAIGSSSTKSVFFMYFRWQDAEGVNRLVTRDALIDTFFCVLDWVKEVADVWGDLHHVIKYALTWCDLPFVDSQLVEDVRRAAVDMSNLLAARIALAESYGQELDKIFCAEQDFERYTQWRVTRQAISFESFHVDRDFVRRALCPGFPYAKLRGESVCGYNFAEGKMSNWPFEVCRFLTHHQWNERKRFNLENERMNRARATLNHLVISTPTLAPVLKYDFADISHGYVNVLCTIARELCHDRQYQQVVASNQPRAIGVTSGAA